MIYPIARIGDRIKFRVTVREGTQIATRKVVGQYGDGYEVRFRGYATFIVHRHEVLTIYRPAETIDVPEDPNVREWRSQLADIQR